MIFGDKNKNLAQFLLITALLTVSSTAFAQTENFMANGDESLVSANLDLSQEGILDSSNIHQAEVDSVLAEQISYSDAEREADFPGLIDLLNSKRVQNKKIFASKSGQQRLESSQAEIINSAFNKKNGCEVSQQFAFENSELERRFCSEHFIYDNDSFDSLADSGSSRKKRKKTTILTLNQPLATSKGSSIICPASITVPQGSELSYADLYWETRSTSTVHSPEGGVTSTARRQWFNLEKNAFARVAAIGAGRNGAISIGSRLSSPEGLILPRAQQAGSPIVTAGVIGQHGNSRYGFCSLVLPSSVGLLSSENKRMGIFSKIGDRLNSGSSGNHSIA